MIAPGNVVSAMAVVAAAVLGSGCSAQSMDCEYNGVDYSSLINDNRDYSAVSELYSSYEFIFNMCRLLIWSDGTCYSGAGVCERLVDTHVGTEVYGVAHTGQWQTDSSGQYAVDHTSELSYITMDGPTCMFGGIPMQARIYQMCQTDNHDTPTVSVLHESYYECKIYLGLSSHLACTADPDPKKQGFEVGTLAVVGCLVGLSFVVYLGAGAYYKHKRGASGLDKIPNREFWKSLPGLVVDGVEYTKGSVLVAMNSKKMRAGEDTPLIP